MSDRSALLSLLLDEVTGTQEAIEIRQDLARIQERQPAPGKLYYTGSKAEGLHLPGSDDDFMIDINQLFNVQVTQSIHEVSNVSSKKLLYMSTENVRPGFALLQVPIVYPGNIGLATERVDGVLYLGSNLLVQNAFNFVMSTTLGSLYKKRQGPSMEHNLFEGWSEGVDNVLSIHCSFWPHDALEWRQRPRPFGWPTPSDICSIIKFGCHLVAVGHPHSDTKLREWRISFSMAERALVWSFNHVQLQCYAVMKIILKEFIKTNCTPSNQVLCSYFVKTFLFWKFETTDMSFWRADNFTECIRYLVTKFAGCLRNGILPHYFIPKFNLLSVKLTREAQRELLQLFDIVLQYDISILRECKTLQTVWSKVMSAGENQRRIIHNARKRNFLKTEEIMVTSFLSSHSLTGLGFKSKIQTCLANLFGPERKGWINLVLGALVNLFLNSAYSFEHIVFKLHNLPCKTQLKSLIMKQFYFEKYFKSRIIDNNTGNRKLYTLRHIAYNKLSSLDLSRNKLWYAIVLLKKQDFNSALLTVNHLLSSIPPFACGLSTWGCFERTEAKSLYADMFMNSECTMIERLRQAWLMPLVFEPCMTDVVPLAIQIELYFCNIYIFEANIPLFVMLFYLAFQCYHELRQYDKRDNALRLLLDLVNSHDVQHDITHYHDHHSYNITGHCLLIAGKIAQARAMFRQSNLMTEIYEVPSTNKGTAASWYLQTFC